MSSVRENALAFFIVTMKPISGKDYDDYREARSNLAQIYANGILERFPNLKQVIGISCERVATNIIVRKKWSTWSNMNGLMTKELKLGKIAISLG